MRASSLLLSLLLVACAGPQGPDGLAGADGATGPAGADGATGPAGADGADGANGHNAGYIDLEVNGVTGFVTDTSGAAVTGGTIYFVDASEVAALPETTEEIDSTNDEPLEDVIAAMGSSLPSADLAEDGSYRLPKLDDGTWFLTYVPASDDAGHLPGGSLCRESIATADLVGTQQDIEVSAAPPADATYVGSGVCMNCHGKTDFAHTMHRNGIWSPYEYGPLQDTVNRPELWEAFDNKFEPGQTVYFYDYDSSRGFDKYKTSETDPGSGVSFTTTLRMINGQYGMTLHNVANPSDPDETILVDTVYGGGLHKQRYLIRIAGDGGDYLAVGPLQYQHEGDESSDYERTRHVWRDYHGDRWYDESSQTLTVPSLSKSFEKNCISCHAAGVQVTGSDDTTWTANTITDREDGDFDFNGDGYAEEMNIGCENCHGPGSKHWSSTGQGKYIVTPSLLTPSRESMICGQCHSRPKGALGTDMPVNADGWMMWAGTSRNDYLTNYAVTQIDGEESSFYTDPAEHSKSHHQQYSDFIRSGMYKNDTELVACSSCHDPHGSDNPRMLVADPEGNSDLCSECHDSVAADLSSHIDNNIGTGTGAYMGSVAGCVDCHMVKTAKSGAGEMGLNLGGTQYWMNDISSHIFDVPEKADTDTYSMPTPYIDACGVACHSTL